MDSKLVKLAIAIFLITFGLPYNTVAEDGVSNTNKKDDNSASVQEAINRDQELLKKLMMQTRSPDPEIKDIEFEIGDSPVEGSSSARLIMIQFSDYTCSHCALYTNKTYPEILKNYVNTGKLRYVIIDYPLPNNFPAIMGAEAVHCASEQGKFREMHEEIMRDQKSLGDITSIASFINLNMDEFSACMESKKYEAVINENIELGTKLKIPSVPNFIVARIDPENSGKVKGISYIRGAKKYEYFKQEIDKALADLN
ncbi:MAG: thioredoxin domain-containing protein [Desulfobacteraceae bacterium]|jgi:protein-disulfide isomerase